MRRKDGFTFIELLIAVSIFAIVATALYSAFFGGITVWKRSGPGGNIYQDVRFAFDSIAQDLKNAVYMTAEEESQFVFFGSKENIAFITVEPVYSETGSNREIARVAYSFDREAGQLIRSQAGRSSGFNVEAGEKDVLLAGVEECTFEYCYDSGDEDEPYLWEEEWKDEDLRLPRGIKVTARVSPGEKANTTLRFSRIVFVPTGILGTEEAGL